MQELRELPARVAGVELQIVQLRDEMQVAFSATRSELNGKVDSLRAELNGTREDLRAEIRAGDQATRDFMRMLHEDNKEAIKTMGDGKKGRKR